MERLQSALERLLIRRASLHEIVLQANAAALAQCLYQEYWCGATCSLPTEWQRAELRLLPQPAKPPKTPEALRPICLQYPVYKVSTGFNAERTKIERPRLCEQLPCYAYLEQRSADNCLLRAFRHCNEVTRLIASAPQRPGCATNELRGSIQLCIDMSRDFDQVRRQLVDHSNVGMVEAQYICHLPQRSANRDPAARGIKQGSRSEPLEWNLMTRNVLQKLLADKGIMWLQKHVANYADDFHVCWTGCDERSLHKAVQDAAEILSLLGGLGSNSTCRSRW